MIKIMVVIPTYNQEKYIGQAIESVLMQKTKYDFKITVADDCSTDNTQKVIQKYVDKYKDIIIPRYNKVNLGFMDNHIESLSSFEAEYVSLLDGDDYWIDENKLQKQVEFLEEHKDYNIAGHRTEVFYENGKIEDVIWPNKYKETSDFKDLIEGNFIPANSAVYRWQFNEKKLKTIFPKNIVPSDYYMHLLHAKTGKIKMFSDVMSRYRRHDEAIWLGTHDDNFKDNFNMKYGEKSIKFFEEVEKNFDVAPTKFYEIKRKKMLDLLFTYAKTNRKEEIIKVFDEFGNLACDALCEMIKKCDESNNIKNEINNIKNEINQKISQAQDSITNNILEVDKKINERIYTISDDEYYKLSKFKKILYLLLFNKGEFEKHLKFKKKKNINKKN